jgi:hypothetical protein
VPTAPTAATGSSRLRRRCSRSSCSPPSSWPPCVPSRWPLPPPALNPCADLPSPSPPGPDTTSGRRGPARSRSSRRRALPAPRPPRAPIAPVAPTIKRRLPDRPAAAGTGRPGREESRGANPWRSRPPGLLPRVLPPRAAPAGDLDRHPPAVPRRELAPPPANRPSLRARAHPAPARARAPPARALARAPTPRPASRPARPGARPAPAEPSAPGCRQAGTPGNPTRILPARGESDTVSVATELSRPGSTGYKMNLRVSIPSRSVLAHPANHPPPSP